IAVPKATGEFTMPLPNSPGQRVVQGPKPGDTKIVAGLAGDPFRDEAPKGSILVGLQIGLGKAGANDYVSALQPTYQTPAGPVAGTQIGSSAKRAATVQAKDGYAVSGLSVKSGSQVDA